MKSPVSTFPFVLRGPASWEKFSKVSALCFRQQAALMPQPAQMASAERSYTPWRLGAHRALSFWEISSTEAWTLVRA